MLTIEHYALHRVNEYRRLRAEQQDREIRAATKQREELRREHLAASAPRCGCKSQLSAYAYEWTGPCTDSCFGR